MQPSRHALLAAILLLAGATSLAAQAELVWLQNPATYTVLDSAAWTSSPQHDVEAADDFDFVGDVTRVIAYGYHPFQSPGPASIDGVYVRFYESLGGVPGALQHQVFVPAGDPGLLYTLPPKDFDVTLPLPFEATGQHFVSVQVVSQDSHSWGWWNHKHGSADTTTLGSAHVRDNLAGGGWQLYETVFGAFQVDLGFEVWGVDGTPPVDPVDPCGPWQQLAVPPLPANYSTTVLRDIVAISDEDVWAVGNPSVEVLFLQYEFKNLALHWDGHAWQEIPTPNPSVFPAPYGDTGLYGVDATSSDHVWAVGNHELQDAFGFIVDQPLVLEWDGTDWTQIPVPNTNYDTSTNGLKMLAEDDVWIVGGGVTPCGGGLAIHYDGSGFEVVDTPGPCGGIGGGTPGFDLEAVDGVASDDVWAVGGGSDGDFTGTSYVLHWDGSEWSYVDSPEPGLARRLFDVHARASDDVWAVGQYEQLVGGLLKPFAYAIHWDGSSWTLFDGATTPVGSLSVHAFGPDDVYSAGGQIYHYDGTSWSVADDLGQLDGEVISAAVAGLDAASPCRLFAAGRQIVAGEIVPFTASQGGVGAPVCDGYQIAYGRGFPGTGGELPLLGIEGCTDIGEPFHLLVDGTVGGAFGLLFVGTAPGAIPFQGGTFLLADIALQVPVLMPGTPGAAGEGFLSVPLVLLDPAFAGVEICLQAAFVDAGAAHGVSLTNGVRFMGL